MLKKIVNITKVMFLSCKNMKKYNNSYYLMNKNFKITILITNIVLKKPYFHIKRLNL